ncbi:MAG: ATP-dependent Clp protease adaptor ClpS [Spirochaetales bacterium]|nr:ATP-dependent Clp protease adaptor ClpS [Spirochaetales bacterium]
MNPDNRVEQRTFLSEDVDEPKQYRVVLLNDDFTTKDFVVAILVGVFHKTHEEALFIMEDVHRKGRGVVGSYIYDIAATRCVQVHEAARQNGYPLRCVMEQL